MEKVIITTPEELRSLIIEAVNTKRSNETKPEIPQVSDNLNVEDALIFLRDNGYPTSKAKLYKLTSTDRIPYKKYGIKLVFSRKELLQWAESQTIRFNDNSDGEAAVIRSANNKR